MNPPILTRDGGTGFGAVPPARPSAWRFFPLGIIASLVAVIAVNGYIIWSAVRTFPGAATQDSFDHGNDYNAVLARAEAQARLGWNLAVDVGDGHVVVMLRDARSQPIPGIAPRAEASRPLGDEHRMALTLAGDGPGRWRSVETLPLSGLWQVVVQAGSGDRRYSATRRVVVP